MPQRIASDTTEFWLFSGSFLAEFGRLEQALIAGELQEAAIVILQCATFHVKRATALMEGHSTFLMRGVDSGSKV